MLTTYIQLFISGLSIGLLYALPALGITLIWNAAGIFNFANGDYVMLAAYLTYHCMVVWQLPFAATLLVVVAFMFLFGIAMEWLIVENLRRKNHLRRTMISFIALSMILRYVARFIWGTKALTYDNPFGKAPLNFGDFYIMPHVFWIFGICIVLMLGLVFLYKKTKLGIAMRATTQNRQAAALMGIRTRNMTNLVFGISGACAGIAGALSGCLFYASMDMGASFGTKAFAGLVIGGFGSPVGAVVGGLLVGVVETFGAFVVSSQWKDVITYAILILFLLVNPRGLFQQNISEKV